MANKDVDIKFVSLTEEDELRKMKELVDSDFNKKLMQKLKDYDEGKWELQEGAPKAQDPERKLPASVDVSKFSGKSWCSDLRSLIENLLATGYPKSIWVFGSRARGTDTALSDLDIFVEIDDATTLSPFKVSRVLHRSVPSSLDVSVDIVVAKTSAFNALVSEPGTLFYEIRKDGVRVWG